MAATSRGIVVSSALQGRVVADLNKPPSGKTSSSLPRIRGFVLRSSRSFRASRTIQKSTKLKRSASRVFMRISSAPSAMLQCNNYFTSNGFENFTSSGFDNFTSKGFGDYMSKKLQADDEEIFKFDDDVDTGVAVDENDSSPAMVDRVNAVLADIVDGQKFLKETGRTKARPMKRRALVVSLALGALQDPLNSVESRLGSLRRTPSTGRMSRTPSASGFALTAQLMSQMTFGSPHS